MSQPTDEVARLTVRLDAIVSNYRLCCRLAGPAAVGAVVKADAYGLGSHRVVQSLEQAGCDTFFVARLEEGVGLRALVPSARIFVLDGLLADRVPAFVSNRLTPVLNSLTEIAAWNAASRSLGGGLDGAIHIDTGMNRLGLTGQELSVLSSEAKKRLSDLRVVLLISHLACADDPHSQMNRIQLDRFHTALALLPAAPASLASSAGVLLGKEFAFDLVRPGIGLYGGNVQNAPRNPFAVAAELVAPVLQLRRIDSGESVGYGATFRAKRPSIIATIELGYADGLMRVISSRGHFAMGQIRLPIVGRVSMDLVCVDATDAPAGALSAGSKLEVFGDTITLEDVATAAGTVAYEILTSVGPRVKRRYQGASA